MKLVRVITVLWFVCLCSLTLHTASAQSDSVQCGTFSNDQAAAQAYFDENGQPEFLDGDGDGDGIACASLEDGDYTGGPSAGPSGPSAGPSGPSAGPSGPSAGPGDITCGSFNNDQAAAQDYFEMAGHPYNLDLDGDGVACASPEDGDYTGGPSAGPEDASDTAGTSAGPEDTSDTANSSVAVDEESASTAVVFSAETNNVVTDALPVTGSGPQLPLSPSNALGLLLAMSLIAGAGALTGRRLLHG